MACIVGIIIVPIIHKRMAIAENILAHRHWEKFGNRWNNVNGIERWQIFLRKEYCLKIR